MYDDIGRVKEILRPLSVQRALQASTTTIPVSLYPLCVFSTRGFRTLLSTKPPKLMAAQQTLTSEVLTNPMLVSSVTNARIALLILCVIVDWHEKSDVLQSCLARSYIIVSSLTENNILEFANSPCRSSTRKCPFSLFHDISLANVPVNIPYPALSSCRFQHTNCMEISSPDDGGVYEAKRFSVGRSSACTLSPFLPAHPLFPLKRLSN